jgi:hypothetical protein
MARMASIAPTITDVFQANFESESAEDSAREGADIGVDDATGEVRIADETIRVLLGIASAVDEMRENKGTVVECVILTAGMVKVVWFCEI